MLVERERLTAVDPQGLEDAVPDQEPVVGRRHASRLLVEQRPVEPDLQEASASAAARSRTDAAGGLEQARRLVHRLAPLECRVGVGDDGAADVQVQSARAPRRTCGSRPTGRGRRRARTSRSRRSTGPRRTGSSSSMISSARILGAPGHGARRERGPHDVGRRRLRAQARLDGRDEVVDARVATRARTAARPRPSRSAATRPRSLRARSTIITFSARSLALERSASALRAGPRRAPGAARPRALDRAGLDARRRAGAGSAPARPRSRPRRRAARAP